MRGKTIQLSGKPRDYPEMSEDTMEVIINGGMVFLFAFGVPQVMHEDSASEAIQELIDGDLQARLPIPYVQLCLPELACLEASALFKRP